MTNGVETAGVQFKDRTTGLIVFGILEIVFGGLMALLVPLMGLVMVASTGLRQGSASPMSLSMMLPSLFLYALLAVWFIGLGIGSLRARRWARALLLVSSWLWLVGGLIGMAFMLACLPDMYAMMGQNGQVPRGFMAVMKGVMLAFMAVFYVIIPGTLVLFYGSRHVKATCERADPQVRWTDRCPLPVLGVCLVCGFSAGSLLLMGVLRWPLPFFGCLLNGLAGAALALVSAALLGAVAWGAWHLRLAAWWCAIGLLAAWVASTCLTFTRVTLIDFYVAMHMPAQQLEMMRPFVLAKSAWMVLFSGLWGVVVLGYLLYVHRYFARPAGPVETEGEGAVPDHMRQAPDVVGESRATRRSSLRS